MSVVFIVATHGVAAKELLNTCYMLMGEQEDVHSVDFVPGENAEILADKYRAIMGKYPEGTQFLYLIDLWGGSPFNAFNMAGGDKENCAVVTGVNIPGLISAFEARDEGEDFLAIAEEACKGARAGVRSTHLMEEQFKPGAAASAAKPAAAAAPAAAAPAAAAPAQSSYNGPDKRGSQEIEVADNKTPFNISLIRIDDRLIHGQVATVWSKVAQAQRIVVINDQVAKDKLRTNMLKQAVPPGITAHVVDVAKASRVYNNPEYAGEKFLLLFTNPTDILKLKEQAKWPITKINVGGMSYKDGMTRLTKAVNVSPEDVKSFKKLAELGVELDVRQVATDNSQDLIKIFKDHNL